MVRTCLFERLGDERENVIGYSGGREERSRGKRRGSPPPSALFLIACLSLLHIHRDTKQNEMENEEGCTHTQKKKKKGSKREKKGESESDEVKGILSPK